jgi:hypothetical protein
MVHSVLQIDQRPDELQNDRRYPQNTKRGSKRAFMRRLNYEMIGKSNLFSMFGRSDLKPHFFSPPNVPMLNIEVPPGDDSVCTEEYYRTWSMFSDLFKVRDSYSDISLPEPRIIPEDCIEVYNMWKEVCLYIRKYRD